MINEMQISLPEKIENAVQIKIGEWKESGKIRGIWKRDETVWTGEDEDEWLGWLGIVHAELENLDAYKSFAEDVEKDGFSDIVLCGMGGSSLCPEVLAKTFGIENFHVLDSTVPAQVKTLEAKIDPAKTLFIVSSKSGSTLETNVFRQYFYQKTSDAVGLEKAGEHFVAVTDPGSKLEKIAERDKFRRIFYGEPSVGGRFSALSAFGLVPAAAMGIDVGEILKKASEMVEACRREDPGENPGAMLGTILGVSHKKGRDKLTIFASPEIYELGAWLEQLIAESTGKDDLAIIPIDREEIQAAEDYDEDRVFAYLKLKNTSDASLDEKIKSLEAYGHPFVRIEIEDKQSIGQEFFRWEFATAVAGAVLKINPFNQPDVEAAKIEAKKLTDEFEETGELPSEEPFFEEDGIKLFSGREHVELLDQFVGEEKSLEKYLNAHIEHLQAFDYLAILAFIEMNEQTEELLQKLRHRILRKELVATALGFGPRFLHSTGQAYKGGANNGVFLQITAEDSEDLEIPEQKYTFGIVKAAQARGDFQVLLDRDRRALRVHLSENVEEDLNRLIDSVKPNN